jgi:hypothetical protein
MHARKAWLMIAGIAGSRDPARHHRGEGPSIADIVTTVR